MFHSQRVRLKDCWLEKNPSLKDLFWLTYVTTNMYQLEGSEDWMYTVKHDFITLEVPYDQIELAHPVFYR